MIELVGVTQHYGIRPVLKNINLRIDKGELAVVVGPNGMGKSTMLGVLGGVLTPQKGYAAIAGLRRRSTEEDELAIRSLAVYLPDRPWLPGLRTGREFILAVGRVYGVADERVMEHAQRLLSLFHLLEQGDTPIRSYSAGQQKKIALCGALITEAPVLLLDEPFSGGLDPAGIMALKRVLQRRVKEHGATVVLTSPVPEIVEELATKVVVLRAGEVIAYETIDGLRRMSGMQGALGHILERMLYPDTSAELKSYFEDLKP